MPSGAATIAVGNTICGACATSSIDQPSAGFGNTGCDGSAPRAPKTMAGITSAIAKRMCMTESLPSTWEAWAWAHGQLAALP